MGQLSDLRNALDMMEGNHPMVRPVHMREPDGTLDIRPVLNAMASITEQIGKIEHTDTKSISKELSKGFARLTAAISQIKAPGINLDISELVRAMEALPDAMRVDAVTCEPVVFTIKRDTDGVMVGVVVNEEEATPSEPTFE